MDCNLPGSSVRGIFQARILKWVAMPSSRESSQPKGQTHVSCYSCLGRWILYHCSTWEARSLELIYFVYMTLHICRTATPLFPYPQPLLTTILLSASMKAKALVIQLCPTLCDPMDCSLPGSFVHGILQARILKWVAMPSSRGSSQPRD